jgi:hypothetical protein
MYKLREQRLKEFYTTGEVLSDVLSTSTSSLDGSRRDVSASNLKNSQRYGMAGDGANELGGGRTAVASVTGRCFMD